MIRNHPILTIFKVAIVATGLFSSISNAQLISINVTASDYIETETEIDILENETLYSSTVYTPISPTNFTLSYDLDFSTMRSQFLYEIESDGKLYSNFYSEMDAELLTLSTPFTKELQNMLPSEVEDPLVSHSYDSFSYYSSVVSDVSSGEILQDESTTLFGLRSSQVLQNYADGAFYKYNYSLHIQLIMPAFYSTPTAVELSNKELLDTFLSNSAELDLIYNETTSSLVDDEVILTHQKVGYVGDATLEIEVPSPPIFSIFALAAFSLIRKRPQT